MHHARLQALLLVTLIAAGCNATGVAPLPTPTAIPVAAPTIAAPAVTTPVALRGTWTADVEGTSASSGAWKLIISDSNLALQNPIGGEPFTLDPTTFTETSVVFPAGADCPDQTVVTPGTYTVALNGETLVFKLVSDSCGDRSATLVTAPWTRVP